jgi:hypothetical protein
MRDRDLSFREKAMHTTSQKIRDATFFLMVAIFSVLVALFSLGGHRNAPAFQWAGLTWRVLAPALAIGFALSGLVQVVLTLRLQEARLQKTFFLLAGAAALAIPICAILHNVVYGLFIWWFGEGFWAGHGTDEPVFFLLAVVVCPALFVVGSVGSMVVLIKARMSKQGNTQ